MLLSNCIHLTSFPKDLGNLTDLPYLDVTSTPLIKMPPNFGKSELLRHLTTFVVSTSIGLRALSQLHGSLSIVNLQSIIDATDALRANWIRKIYLDELVFK